MPEAETYRRFYTDEAALEIGRCRRLPVILDPNLTLVEPVNRWFLSLAKRGLAESTIRAYSDAVLDWLRTLHASKQGWAICEWDEATEDHFHAYFISTERKNSRATANQFVLRVMFFYRWALGRKYITHLPWRQKARFARAVDEDPVACTGRGPGLTDTVRRPIPHRDVFTYTDEQIRAIFALLSHRDRLIAKWALLCGLRRLEIANLTNESILAAQIGSVVIVTLPQTKAGYAQPVVVPKRLWAESVRYIELERAACLAEATQATTLKGETCISTNAVFVNRYGQAITATRISKNWLKARRNAGLSSGVFHDLRHTFADNLLSDLLLEQQKRPDLNVDKALQAAVRHQSVATTYKFYISLKHRERALVNRALERRSEQLAWDDDASL